MLKAGLFFFSWREGVKKRKAMALIINAVVGII